MFCQFLLYIIHIYLSLYLSSIYSGFQLVSDSTSISEQSGNADWVSIIYWVLLDLYLITTLFDPDRSCPEEISSFVWEIKIQTEKTLSSKLMFIKCQINTHMI